MTIVAPDVRAIDRTRAVLLVVMFYLGAKKKCSVPRGGVEAMN